MEEIIVAGHNRAKVEELRRQLQGVATVSAVPPDISPKFDEDIAAAGTALEGTALGVSTAAGDAFEWIARAKAAAWSRVLPRRADGDLPLVVATDGGLLVPGLGCAWDPKRTRRFAGEVASLHERVTKLLERAAHLHGNERRIGWREALAIARDGEVLDSWIAESPGGWLATAPADPAGDDDPFWVPLVWSCPEFGGRRLAELSTDERQARADHWSVLGQQLRRWVARSSSPLGC